VPSCPVAIDGITILENGRQVTDFLRAVRRAIADRQIERRIAYGHGYWIKHEAEAAYANDRLTRDYVKREGARLQAVAVLKVVAEAIGSK